MKGYGARRNAIGGGYAVPPHATPKRKHETRTADPKQKKADKKRARRQIVDPSLCPAHRNPRPCEYCDT